MLPEFKVNSEYNIKQAWDDFYQDPSNADIVEEIDKNFGEALDKFIKEQTDENEEIDEDDIEYFTKELKSWLKKEGIKKYQLSETAQSRFANWFSTRKNDYFINQNITKIKYDFSKGTQQQSLEARNNLIIDMMWSVLTNKDTASKILNPGGFNYQKRAARIVTILNSSTEDSLRKELGLGSRDSIINKLLSLPLKARRPGEMDLSKLAEKTKSKMNPLSPRTQIKLHQQNMTGAKLIGIYANHNANHALMQHTQLELNEDGAFILNGKKLTSLHDITNANKEFISRNNAGYLAASVDNVKDPVLAGINQNTFTADATMLLSRLGYNPIEIGLLMSQPIIKEITQTYFRESREGKSANSIIESVIREYSKKAALMQDLTYDNYKNNKFLLEDLANNILYAKEMDNITDASQTDNYDKVEYYKRQVAVGYLFTRIMRSSDALSKVVQTTRADTNNGAAGPTIADTEIKLQKLTDLEKAIRDDYKFPLDGADILTSMDIEPEGKYYVKVGRDYVESTEFDEEKLSNENFEDLTFEDFTLVENKEGKKEYVIKDSGARAYNLTSRRSKEALIRARLLNSELPYLQAFFSLGVEETQNMLAPYFPQFNESFKEVIEDLRGFTKTGKLNVKTMNSIYNDLLAYIMTKTEFFGTEITGQGEDIKVTTSEEKRRAFINHFPDYYKKVVSDNEDIAELGLIKRLKAYRADDNNPVETIRFSNVGALSSPLKDRFMRDWISLLYMPNPEAQKLAVNLFRYNFYRNGFAFGPNTFIHLAPVALRKVIPGYIGTLNGILNSRDSYRDFVYQYIYNHLDNRKLVPEIPESSDIVFEEDGELKDTITVNITPSTSYDTMKCVKERIETPDGPMYTFFNFISRRYHGGYIYYRLSPKSPFNGAVYDRIEPLGAKNSFLEYEYGKDVSEMKSVIEEDSKNYVTPDIADYITQEAPEMDDSTVSDFDNYQKALEASVMQQSYSEVYGEPLPQAETVDDSETIDLSKVSPNMDYLDAEDNPTCRFLSNDKI